MAIGYGASLPLRTTAEDGPYALLKRTEDVASQNLKMLILTSPGERIMDNKFGVGIRNYLFWQYTPATLSDIESRIRQQTARYIPYINIREVNFNADGTAIMGSSMADNFLSIEVKYQIVPLNVGAVLTLPFSS
jgi:phage baseplate assembly protein W